MTRKEILLILDEVVEEDPGTLDGTEVLKELEGWNSMAVLSFQTEVDTHFGMRLSSVKLMPCKTVNDLIELLGDKVAAN